MRNTDPTFGDLVELRQKMLRWARKMCGQAHQAEDLTQEALLRMFANRHKFDPAGGGVDQWARVVLLNAFRMQRRKDARMPLVSIDSANAEHSWSPRESSYSSRGESGFSALRAPDNPHTAVYCRQVCRFLGFDAAMLLAEPESPMTATQRTQRRRARLALEARVAA